MLLVPVNRQMPIDDAQTALVLVVHLTTPCTN